MGSNRNLILQFFHHDVLVFYFSGCCRKPSGSYFEVCMFKTFPNHHLALNVSKHDFVWMSLRSTYEPAFLPSYLLINLCWNYTSNCVVKLKIKHFQWWHFGKECGCRKYDQVMDTLLTQCARVTSITSKKVSAGVPWWSYKQSSAGWDRWWLACLAEGLTE